MTPNEIANVLESLVLTALITVVLLRWWATARLDAFRQDLFIVRDKLFDYAQEGKIGFDDPAYRLLRQLFNGMIRYAHQLTFFRVCITMFQIKVLAQAFEPEWSAKWNAALGQVKNPTVRADLNAFHDRSMARAAHHLVFGSPILVSLVVCTIIFLGVRQGWHNVRDLFARAPEKTVSRIVDTQIIENKAAAAA
jgi:hypothetical protein